MLVCFGLAETSRGLITFLRGWYGITVEALTV